MEDLSKKINIMLPDGATTAEVIIREGDAPKVLDPKEPLKLNINGTLGCVFEYLAKRLQYPEEPFAPQKENEKMPPQVRVDRSHLVVCREESKLVLVVNEHDAYKKIVINGSLSLHEAFLNLGINSGKYWEPEKLGLFIKMHRAYFADKAEAMKICNDLMKLEAKVDAVVTNNVDASGSRGASYAQIVSSNMPEAFKVRIPIFSGNQAETFEIETFAQVDGRNITVTLLSPGANETIEDYRDKAIDAELEKIKQLCPELAIFEI